MHYIRRRLTASVAYVIAYVRVNQWPVGERGELITGSQFIKN